MKNLNGNLQKYAKKWNISASNSCVFGRKPDKIRLKERKRQIINCYHLITFDQIKLNDKNCESIYEWFCAFNKNTNLLTFFGVTLELIEKMKPLYKQFNQLKTIFLVACSANTLFNFVAASFNKHLVSDRQIYL